MRLIRVSLAVWTDWLDSADVSVWEWAHRYREAPGGEGRQGHDKKNDPSGENASIEMIRRTKSQKVTV